MKKIIASMLVLTLLLCTGSVFAQTFSDTEGHWAEGEIEKAYQNKVIQGDPDGSFRPDDTVSRAEFIKMLTAEICTKMQVEIPQYYANGSHWSSLYANFSAQNIHRPLTEAQAVNGLIPGAFGVGNYDLPIERWEMAYLISEAVRNVFSVSGDSTMASYTDLIEVTMTYHEILVDAIGNCVALGMIQGDEEGYFNPAKHGTRAEAATLINRFDALANDILAYYDALEQQQKEFDDTLITYDAIPEGHPVVTMVMEDGGSIKMELYPEYAPQTVANFISLVKSGFYDGLTFHRVVEGFMAQGGDPAGNGTGGSSKHIKGEFAANNFATNTLSHTRGVISMARAQDFNSASSQFFICYDDASFLDGQYAAFGKVIEGMEVVDGFLKAERTANSSGELSTPKKPIVIKQVTVK